MSISSTTPRHTSTMATKNNYNEAFFQHWLDDNTAKIKAQLPQLDASHTKFFLASCQHVQDCLATKTAAEKKRDEIQKHKPVDQDALDKATAAVKAATEALEKAQDDAFQQSVPLLDYWEQHPISNDLMQMLLQTEALLQGTPKGLAEYCQVKATTDDQAKALVQLLQDPRQFPLLQTMVLAGGAKKGQYGPALELYSTLMPQAGKEPVLQRLALAVALELADPLLEFHQDKTYVDPIQRYLHYEQAWMFGELDPVFDSFTVWELRMVVNSDAPNDQLGWGRQMLMNYRPDLMVLNDRWRYCRIVRTDVYYTGHPNWDPSKPLDYPQILSGGGECGPRAWMGRFICKAFGIPTWGVREPGHAAMARWTPNEGWVVCLGAEMKWAWWDDQCGLYFQLETEARKACRTPCNGPSDPNLMYGQKVMALEWIANLLREPTDQIVRHNYAEPKALWRSLSLMERRRLAKTSPTYKPWSELEANDIADDCSETSWVHEDSGNGSQRLEIPVTPQLERLQLRNNSAAPETTEGLTNYTIIIPAANYADQGKPDSNVATMDSFLGGKQLFLNHDGHVQYALTLAPGGQYKLTCRYVTVHDDKPVPFMMLYVDAGNEAKGDGNVDENLCGVYSIKLPYTKGMWGETEPTIIELPENAAMCTITIVRDPSSRGLVLKDLKLVPVNKD